ncbi:hypothetical protein CEXT_651351 [Caerostris extrusa]|uniref:Uncharacterized protein n=1 Tax=Caerostris extrusa TaxID=172846 RepID=A0AAV4T736_CAEEX|nr:hypothetical protein CEXT_651351 [Caerostris extrusa]
MASSCEIMGCDVNGPFPNFLFKNVAQKLCCPYDAKLKKRVCRQSSSNSRNVTAETGQDEILRGWQNSIHSSQLTLEPKTALTRLLREKPPFARHNSSIEGVKRPMIGRRRQQSARRLSNAAKEKERKQRNHPLGSLQPRVSPTPTFEKEP